MRITTWGIFWQTSDVLKILAFQPLLTMPDCTLCKNKFPRLDKDMEACTKCRARKPGMSAADAVINVCYPFFRS